jgi:Protein O-mannosyl-transferase TMEM260-like
VTKEARDVKREDPCLRIHASSRIPSRSARPGYAVGAGGTGRFTYFDYFLALLAGLLAFVLYFRTLAPGLLFGDSAEFQMASWLGGFAHPTGYPLYLLLGNIWTHLLQAGDPAWRMNLLSALFGSLAVGLVYLLALRITALSLRPGEWSPAAARLAALFAALTFAAMPTFWSQAIITEVYTLNAAFVAAVLLGLTTWAAQPPDRQSNTSLYLTAAIYGLSLTHHRSMLLLVPAIAMYLWLKRSRWESSRAAFHVLGRALTLVLVPLLIYLYIPLRAPHAPYATVRLGPEQTLQLYRPTLGGFIDHVSGQVFGSALGAPASLADRLASVVRLFVAETSWAVLGLGLVGLIWSARRSRSLLALMGLAFLTIIAFNLSYRIGDIFVFYIPAYLVWILWEALGVVGAGALMSRAVAQRGPQARAAVLLAPCVLALAVPAWSLVQHYSALDRSADRRARATWQAILAEPIPSNAVLVSNDRDEMVPLWYLQYVEGMRPDLTGLFPLIQPTSEWADVGQVISTALRSERPVLLIKEMPGLETRYQIEPADLLARVTGLAVQKPPHNPRNVDFGGAIRLTGYDLAPARLRGGDTIQVTLYWQPLHPLEVDYTTFVHLVNADGVVIGGSDHRSGGVYYPTSLWQPGDVLRDAHTITLTANLGRPPYAMETGLYTSEPALQHLGQPERLEMPARS